MLDTLRQPYSEQRMQRWLMYYCAKLRQDLVPQGFQEQSIRPDPRDRNAILVIVPGRLMNFEVQRSTLQRLREQLSLITNSHSSVRGGTVQS